MTLAIEATDADAAGLEQVKCDGKLVGWTTSGAFGNYTGQSLPLGYVDRPIARVAPPLTVDVVGGDARGTDPLRRRMGSARRAPAA